MENTSYALYIAVGVLIGIIILSLLLSRWRQIGILEGTKDEVVAVKNKADFNSEYEAYNKKLMYGTDVLSCLNKAQNNNQKYVYNNYYGTDMATIGKEGREEYFIDVVVKINSALYDEVKAYYKDTTGKYQRAIGLGSDTITKQNYSDKVFLGGTSNQFKKLDVYYYYFEQGKVLQASGDYIDFMWPSGNRNKTLYSILNTGKIETNFKADTYHLLTNEDTSSVASRKETAKLAALITTVSLKEQALYNSDQPSVYDKTDWWYCTWTTAASDFKSRKFKCTGVQYNKNHGYIEKISFEEIN